MLAKDFNQGWELLPNEQPGLLGGGPEHGDPVTLPFDALVGESRSPKAPTKDKKGYFPNREASLLKRFDVPKEWADRYVTLEFEGVYAHSKVYVNGQLAGGEPAGYTTFAIELDPYLNYDQTNEIKVVARSTNDSRWYSGVGIYRDVRLYVAPAVQIPLHGLHYKTMHADEKHAEIRVELPVINHAHAKQNLRVVTTLLDDQGQVVASADTPLTLFGDNDQANVRHRLDVDAPKLWAPDAPNLYRLAVQIKDVDGQVLDQSQTMAGIRTIGISHEQGFLINGQAVKLRGACLHHDNGLIGAADIEAAETRRIKKLHEAGFNAIRCAHNQASQNLLNACDRYGMVVMNELSDAWDEPKNDEDVSNAFPFEWKHMIESLVDASYNHPSVMIYSVGNEIRILNSPYGAKRTRELADYLRSLDDTRYLTNATNLLITMGQVLGAHAKEKGMDNDENKGGMDINELLTNMGEIVKNVVSDEITSNLTEEAFESVDIAGYNYATARYAMDAKRFPKRVICGTETYPSQIGENWTLMQQHPYVIGDFTWTGWDYLGEAGIGQERYEGSQPGVFYGEYPWKTAYCGDFDLLGNRRPVSYYREIVFGLRKQPYVAVRYPWIEKKLDSLGWGFIDGISSWTWRGYEGQNVTVEVYAPGDEVALTLNGKEIGKQPLADHKAIFELPYEPGELQATSWENGQAGESFTLQTAADDVELFVTAEQDQIKASDRDLAYVDIALADQNGVINNQADTEIKVTVENGQLLGLGSADPKGTDSFTADHTHTFNGQAQAIIRPAKPGKIKVTVAAENMAAKTIEIDAE